MRALLFIWGLLGMRGKSTLFWIVVMILLVGHIAAYIVLFRRIQQLPSSNYAIFTLFISTE
jgi:hypothetical protein